MEKIDKPHTLSSVFFVYTIWLAILAWRLFMPAFDASVVRVANWSEIFFLLALYGFINLTALGLGRVLVRCFQLLLSTTESILLAYMLGLGTLSMVMAIVGLLGWLTTTGVFIALAISGMMASFEWGGIFRSAWSALRSFRLPSSGSLYEAVFRMLVLTMIPILLVHAFTPVWDYDALLYHLEVPRRFLAHGGIYFDASMMRSAYPFLGEMLFLVGIMFRVESLSKLVHLTYAVLFVFGVYAFGKRFFNHETSLIAVGILVSVPSFILWSTWASIDFAWAGYELWSVYAVSLWLANEKKDSRRWLVLAGVMSGFAASTKYIAIPSLLIVAILIVCSSINGSRQGIAETIRNLLTFGLSAGLVMGAWYVKNLILTGNPVYPLIIGGPGWEPLEAKVFSSYMQTFGSGRSLLNFLLLPYDLYAHQARFSTMPQEIVHPLLWFAFLFPFFVKPRKYNVVIVYAMLSYIWWFLGSQVIRFLLPLSAFLALFAGDVIERLPAWLKNGLKFSLITGLLIFNLAYQTLILRNGGAFAFVAGQKSATEYLQMFVDDYHIKQYIQESVSPDKRVLFLWDGRGYYCDSRCVADTEQSSAVGLATDSPKPSELARDLRDRGISYLMLSSSDARFFITLHDPNGFHRDAWDYYENTFLPACGRSVFRDGGMELFEIICE